MRLLAPALVVLSLSACTWVPMEEGAKGVRVLPLGAASPSSCRKQGDVVVTVKDKVAFYRRNDLKVRDELETLARNEAPKIQADTIQALGDPADGEQRFAAWRCGG
nr:DUF4156 domain-containing protein [Pseudoxanthomonas composti]